MAEFTRHELKKALLELLTEDQDVHKTLKKIFSRLLRQEPSAPAQEPHPHQGERRDNSELEQRLLEAKKHIEAKAQALEQAQQHNNQLEQQLANQQRLNAQLKQQLEQVQKDFAQLQQRSSLPAEVTQVLAQLRQDQELLHRFRLDAQQQDVQLLIQAVAILSSENNIRRLWELYQQRIKQQQTALSTADLQVLRVALGWLNANVPDKPYHLSQPQVGAPYDYQEHTRAINTMSGEVIQAVWLPAIHDLQLKALVMTG